MENGQETYDNIFCAFRMSEDPERHAARGDEPGRVHPHPHGRGRGI
ncbi:MAG: hypothetical protein MZU91_03190 [Desulfosudis oleivorans]|nr:hypothetical protein [Desulfosudis oleivorans]